MRKALIFPFLPLLLLLAGCATFQDDLFVVRRLDDQAKAKALTEQGVEEYHVSLVGRQQYDQLPRVKQYFLVALRYDPYNLQARQHLALLEEFGVTRAREKVREAAAWLARPNRSEEEDYALLVALLAAARLDPANEEAARMLQETARIRSALAEVYIGRSKAAVGRINRDTPPAEREALQIAAFQNASRAAEVDPLNVDARLHKANLRGEVARIFESRSAAIREQIGAGRFEEAQVRVAALADLNRRLGGSFDAEVRSAAYAVNFQRARSLAERKDYAQAAACADAALSVDRTREALALKRRIANLRAEAEREVLRQARGTASAPAAGAGGKQAAAPGKVPADQGPSFDACLQEIDNLIARRDLIGARRRIDALARATKEPARLAILDDRREKVHSFLKALYDRAVAAYRDEKFGEAIELLQTVVQIDVNYELASDYLDKARSKQKVLDQY